MKKGKLSHQPATSGQPVGNQRATSGPPAGNHSSTGSEVPSILFTVFASPKFKNHEDYRPMEEILIILNGIVT